MIYKKTIIKDLLASEYDNATVVAKYEQWMDGTVLTIDENDNVIEFIEKQDFQQTLY